MKKTLWIVMILLIVAGFGSAWLAFADLPAPKGTVEKELPTDAYIR